MLVGAAIKKKRKKDEKALLAILVAKPGRVYKSPRREKK